MNKTDIAEVLREIGILLELKGENPFKIRAYQNGARALENLEEDLNTLIEEKRLDKVNGIGKALATKITELATSGNLPFYTELKASLPAGLLVLLEIPGLGPKKIKVLHETLKIDSIESLAEACRENRVAELEGFGTRTQEKILAGIANREAYGKRHLWWDAYAAAEPILEGLRSLPAVARAEHAGSLRRLLETVGDLDFIVASDEPKPVMLWFTSRKGIAEVTASGETKSSVRLEGGLQADLRVVPPEQFVFALHHFTGSKNHNVQMRQRALQRKLSLSEWGLFPAEGKTELVETPDVPPEKKSVLVPKTEEDLFRHLGLHFIPPELREGIDEIKEAEKGALPPLVREVDIRGVFHNHTHASDGRNSLLEMASAAAARGWEYLGIADHSKASFQANGLDETRLARQLEEIRRLNQSGETPIHLFAGVECDILKDGSLDLDDGILRELDYVVVSVHSSLQQDEKEMTQRLIRAIEHPAATMLGHLTGRLLLQREPCRVDAAKIIDAAAANRVVIELNANPHRLDMDWRHWRRAADSGVLCAINPDAHDTEGYAFIQSGINVARKGWLTAEHVLNTRPLPAIKTFLADLKA